MNFCLYFAYLLLDVGDMWYKDLHIRLKMICELRMNRYREGRTFLMGVNEITH